jgi:23S rRNA (uracil1939-C5)-methyltransferase
MLIVCKTQASYYPQIPYFCPVKKKLVILKEVTVEDYAAEGKSLARVDGKVVFISGAVPGDVVDVQLGKSKKDWAEGKVVHFHSLSPDRATPFCEHFGLCGGCKWQMLPYEKQLQYKQKEVEENLRRIGKLELPALMPIIGGAKTRYYRNKLEFTFSNKRYLLPGEIEAGQDIVQSNAVGFHVPRLFDKVIDINNCHLQEEPSNIIRNTVRTFAEQQGYTFYDIRNHTGWLRTMIVRRCSTGELMLNICFGYEDESERIRLFDHLLQQVPGIDTLLYTINPKMNDTIYDLHPQVYHGKGFVMEKLEDFYFKVGPKSFFQTNTWQAAQLYRVARDFAELSGTETLYDLYCGTGSIGIFASRMARKIIGVETIAEAVEDARENALLNNITHASFFAGDVIKVCDDAFFAAHGRPDVIITDPPRAGMHDQLVKKIVEIAAPIVVYVSCNPATQARDLSILNDTYSIEKVQPVDMFPHTHHIENVVQLKIRK